MTEETKLKSQELLERIHEAREELDALEAEERSLPGKLEQARLEDHEERTRSGITEAITGVFSRVRGVKDRREELPQLIWSARLHILELDAEYNRSRNAELEEPQREAQEEFTEVDALLPKVQKRREAALDRVIHLTQTRRDHERREGDALTELEALKSSGPK